MDRFHPGGVTTAARWLVLLAATPHALAAPPPCAAPLQEIAPSALPATIPPIEDPAKRLTDLEEVEDYSEAVANMFVEWGDKIRLRDFHGAADLFAEDFIGHDLSRPGKPEAKAFPLEVSRTAWDVKAGLTVVNRTGFMESWRNFVAPFGTIEFFFVKVRGAEFSDSNPVDGALTTRINIVGKRSGGGRIGRECFGRVHLEKVAGKWQVDRWTVTSLVDIERPETMFTEVARSAGIAHRGPQFGKEGNRSFFWNGAAVADFDADGLWDLFVPSQNENFLYRSKGDGTFEECAAKLGVAQPAGGTGAVFFDYDNDGDLDLLVAHAGWIEGGQAIGHPTQLYRNDGGKFANVSEAAGFTELLQGFSPCVADADNDGDLDVFIPGYQKGSFAGPNSWFAADNGSKNALYVNDGDGTFSEKSAECGFVANRWTYAAAWHDFDEDGDQDLFVANDYGIKEFWRNDGGLKFTDIAAELGVVDVGNGMGCCFGDYDADGDIDLYVSNMSSSAGNRILSRLVSKDSKDARENTLKKLAAGNTLFNFADGKFSAVPSKFGGIGAAWAWAPQFLDLDLDGDLDLACVNGFFSGNSLKDT
jgi:hypothetical protein